MKIGIIIKGNYHDPFTAVYSNEGGTYTDDDQILVNELVNRGHQVKAIRWDSDLEFQKGYDVLLVRSTWDFLLRVNQFNEWLDKCDSQDVKLWNPTAVIRKNISKRYLEVLSRNQLNIIPSVFIDNKNETSLAALIEEKSWQDFIIKPVISGGAKGTVKYSADDLKNAQVYLNQMIESEGEALVQDFMPEICSKGEWSFVFFGEKFSHAVRKVPAKGEFREQAQYGGGAVSDNPSETLIAQADQFREILAKDLPFARIDGIEREGRLYVNEVELIDPRLFFQFDKNAASRLADVIESL